MSLFRARSATLDRRRFLALGGVGAAAVLAPTLTGCSSDSDDKTKALADGVPEQVRYAVIGNQHTGPAAALQQNLSGVDLSASLGGTRVDWRSGFTASLPVMEAFKAGSVDFSFVTATAVIYAIGGKVPIVPLAAYPLPRDEVDILVPQDSPIRGAADLKGRRVADQQGTTGTYSLIKYLETAGLRLSDVEYVNLSAADAEAAYSRGKVDAWISWQPQIELAKRRHNARALPDVKTFDYAFFVASESFVRDFPEAAAKLVREVRDVQRFINANPEKTLNSFTRAGGFGSEPLEREVYLDLIKTRRLSESTGDQVTAVDDAAADGTQDLADNFKALGVYPTRIEAAEFLRAPRFDAVKQVVARTLAT